ncbi:MULTISPECIES: phosphotransferase [unclassified Variovorax]|uniref:phosphotransferase n=1 Tax=unclassified Variovorax TaxID=663243 RepID=UPI00076C5B96|nr:MULTISPECIES: phosphotransferase [unclassified Variovorax]KWT68512.1 putative aminoglycoside phosphotransferase [Variovorax sp. WDL1]PNG46631.1 putative aminoglycoside phosphotransferase [Variovorax sp. B2]PNG48718.1 putative aminoglycoside phosphotransferase [Variovorax sp. B4]VTV14412.1 Putative aminoglycoside phosphotransferase [Variovorax sp. WDL1]
MSEAFSGTTEVHERHRFDEASLQRWFASHVDDRAGAGFRVLQFKGGQSNPTFLVETGGSRYVVRRKPAGALLPSAHAVDREFRVMKALAGTDVPVPRVHALCEDDAVIGTSFYVMDYMDGRILWDPRLPGASADERSRICDEMNRVMAALHEVDVHTVGLGDYGRAGNYIERQIARWSRQYRASETERIDAVERLIEWLPQHVPQETATRIVHGDFRLDNLVFAHDAPRVIAVLDWELSTLGDPMADFAYHCMAWQLPPPFRGLGDLSASQLEALGLPSEQRHLARYCDRRKLPPVTPAAWRFYTAFNLFRAAAIAQGIMGRALAGNASNAHALDAGRQARQLAELGWQRAARA